MDRLKCAKKKVKTNPCAGKVMAGVFLGFFCYINRILPRKSQDHHWRVLRRTTGPIEGCFSG